MLTYSDEMQYVLKAAQWEAQRQGLSAIASQHLLLGLFHLSDGKVITLLNQYKVKPKRERLVTVAIETDIWPPSIDLPELDIRFDVSASAVMEFAQENAQAQKSMQVMPEHVLLGLLQQPKGLGGLLLHMHGLTPAKAFAAFGVRTV